MPDWGGVKDEAAGGAVPQAGFLIDYDRPIGHFGNLGQSLVGIVPRARAIDGQRRIDDRGIVG